MTKYNIFQFRIGKEKKSLMHWIKVGAVVHLFLDTVSIIPGVEKKKVFNFLDEMQLKMNIEMLNDYIIKDTELISYRIDRVIEKSLLQYEKSRKDS